MNKNWYVTKKNDSKELINFKKINKVIKYAAYGLKNISISKILNTSYLQFYNGIKTSLIHKILIKSSADLISEYFPDYQFISARLLMFDLRKNAYGKFIPPSLYDHVSYLVSINKYDKILLKKYSKEEFDLLNKYIDHNRDMYLSYVGVKQLENKYLVQNKITGKIYESLQFVYILISACLFMNYKSNIRIKYVKEFYDAISLFKISLPTPIMSGVRTPTKQFSSCVLIECNDSLDSINATVNSVIKYVSKKAGIGINVGRLRALGSSIRFGEAFHTGCIPFYKLFQSAVKCCSQGGIRTGAATLFYPIWHLEVEDLLVLKNNRGIEENRVRNLDYCIQLNGFMYRRLLDKKKITLFNPYDVLDLYDAFFINQKKFEELYLYYENKNNIRKKNIYAVDLFTLIMQERTSTGRIYIQNVDHCNEHSSFNKKICAIRQSNLCLEVTLPTKPLKSPCSDKGEIALCILSAFNLGEINNLYEIKKLSLLLVRALDELIDYQKYPVYAAKYSIVNRRSLGIGVINFAYYLAKNGVRYSDGSAKKLTHKTFELIQYYLLRASNILAKEKGKCNFFKDTNYYKGILPIDTYKKDVDSICNEPLYCNWNKLRTKIKKYGLRNSTLSAIMPSETSSQISNATNGIEPPRGYITIKASKNGVLKQVLPEIIRLKNKYELLWDLPNNLGYLHLMSIIQKFIDQSISTNTSYNPLNFKNNRIPITVLLKDLLISYKLGIKTLYYQNIKDGAEDQQNYEQDFISLFNCDSCKN